MVESLQVERVEEAAQLIDPVFRGTPQVSDAALSRRVGRELVVKLEMFNPIRSFKGRGADFFMQQVDAGREVVCASAGNFGQAVAYTGRDRGIRVKVFCARTANPAKVARMGELGADVVQVGDDFDAAKDVARAYAENDRQARLFVEDGEEPRISEGAGTIAIELAPLKPDTVLVPVGNGALITGIGCWLKANSPTTKIVGVCAAGAPAMARSWRAGKPIASSEVRTIADGVAVRVPVPAAVDWMRELVDDVVLVEEEHIRDALRAARDTLGLVLEPAGALGIAAALHRRVAGRTLATVATGNNFSADLLAELAH